MLIADDTIDKTDKHLKKKNVAKNAAYKCSGAVSVSASVKLWYRFCNKIYFEGRKLKL